MAQKTVDVEVSAIYSFTYDPESPEFQKSVGIYRELVDKGGNEDGIIVHVARKLHRPYKELLDLPLSNDIRISGVGYLKREGEPDPGGRFSGITVEDDDPDFNYEIL